MAGDFTDAGGGGGAAFNELLRGLRSLQTRLDRIEARQKQDATARQRGATTPSRATDERAVAREERRGRSAAPSQTSRTKGTALNEASGERQAAQAVAKHEDALRSLGRSGGQVNAVTAQSSNLLRRDIQTRDLASQAMRRHGALTTEFFTAAAAGNVTLREMRFQAGATIAKFAGWTLAAGFVFTLVRALGQMGDGAIKGFDSVNQLQRVINNVDTGKAHAQIRSLANDLNLDIGTVGEGLYESAKQSDVAPNQDSAARLAEVALKATKIADLTTADSVKYTTGILRGFKLEVGSAASVLDQLNQVQNDYGVQIETTAAGTNKAAAAFKNAGGRDTQQLIALVATISRAGGFSGDEAGVALRRSAQLIKQPGSINRERLAKFGIDASQPYSQVIEQAIGLAQSGKVKGPKVNELATALSTPNLSARFAALLNRPDLYDKLLGSATHSKGSANKELDRVLKSAHERIAEIGVELGKLGDNLAQAGFFDAFGAFVSLLAKGLQLTNSLVDQFNKLPDPIKSALLVAAQLYGALRLIRRFNPGTLGQTGRGGGFFQQTESQRLRTFTKQAAGGEVKFYRDRVERLSGEAAERRLALENASDRYQAAYNTHGARAAAGDPEAMHKLNTAAREAAGAQTAYARVQNEAADTTKRLNRAVAEQAGLSRRFRREGSVAVATSYGHIPQEGDRPSNRPPAHITPGPPARMDLGAGFNTRRSVNLLPQDAIRESQRVRQDFKRLNSASPLLATAAAGTANVAARTGPALRGAGRSLAGLGRSLGGVAGEVRALVGPFELLIGDALLVGHLIGEANDLADLGRRLQRPAKSIEEARADLERIKAKRRGVTGTLRRGLAKLGELQSGTLFEPLGVLAKYSDDNLKQDERTGRDRIRERRDLERRRNIERRLRLQRRRASRSLTGLGRFSRFSLADIPGELEAVNTLAKVFGPQDNTIGNLAAGFIEAGRKLGSKRDSKSLQQLAAARQQFEQGIQDMQQRLSDDLQLATSGRDRNAAYGRFFGGIGDARSKLRSNLAKVRARAARDQRALTAAQNRLHPERDGTPVTVGDEITGAGARSPAAQKQREEIKKLQKRVKGNRTTMARLRKSERELERYLKLVELQARIERFDQGSEVLQQRAEVQSTGTASKSQQLSIRLGAANRQLQRSLHSGFSKTREGEKRIRQAIIDRNQILQEQADQALENTRARTDLQTARTVGELPRLGSELSGARQVLSLMQKQGRDFSEQAPVMADIARLQQQIAEQALQNARDLADAGIDLALSRTADPNKEARLETTRARQQLRFAGRIADPNQRRIETLRARAKLNEAKGTQRLTRFQGRANDISYLSDIGAITPEQELDRLNRLIATIPKKLLKTVDGMKDFYRDLKKRAHDLKKAIDEEGTTELNVGNVRLPTLYEIRRAVSVRRGGGDIRNASYTTVNVEVNDPNAAGAVYAAIDSASGTSVRGAARAAGVL